MQEGKLKKFLPGFVQIARKRRNLLGDVPSELAGGGKNETIFGHSGGVSAADGLRSEPGGRDDLLVGAKRTAAGAGGNYGECIDQAGHGVGRIRPFYGGNLVLD